MRHSEVIYLISSQIIEDQYGNQREVATERKVFANEFTVTSNIFFNADAGGLKPSKSFEIYSFEYRNESKLKHNGVVYRIIHTEKRGDKTRILCERVIGNG
ncbi:hypothetical protein Cdeb_03357 [Caldibacillus debilis GB1]|uniref:Phage head-tail adaptor, putative, SPP1 family n=1 Tax=Caldibacillus debilis GB1 TaxID=1339248 RepID=A0A420VFT2_9BACI|nr:hypothetical protein Cdeb_03357 [Caldibacillus debilis GB1]